MLYVLLVVAGAALLGLVYWEYRRNVARREALFVFATARGWRFTVSDDALAARWSGRPFGQGDRRRVTNVMRGTCDGRELTAFEYRFDTKSGDDRTTHHYSVVVLAMPAYLPTIEVVPETVSDRIAGAVGLMRDLELESEDFNRKFRVSAKDPKFASDVLTPRTMHLLLARPPLAFRLQGSDVVSWQPGSLEPLDVVTRASTLDAVLTGIPEYLWRDHGASA